MIEAVIFDYGGVFSSPLFRGVGRFEADLGYPSGAVLELLFGETAYIGVEGVAMAEDGPAVKPARNAGARAEASAVTHDWHRLEIGAISLAEYLAGVVARAPAVLGKPLDFDAYLAFMRDMPFGVHWPLVHRARRLKRDGIALALLTNNVKEWGDHWKATIPLDELFPVVVDSSEVGLRKPDARIYELTCSRLNVEPQACVFIDDNADNVAAAAALGMEAVHFHDDPWAAIDELDAILDRRGVARAS